MALHIGKGLPVKGPLPKTGLKTVPGDKRFIEAAVKKMQEKLPKV